MSKPAAIFYDPIFKKHDPGPLHPECPARCDAVMAAIQNKVDEDSYRILKPRKATKEEVLLAHIEDYYELAKTEIESGWQVLSTGDTNVSRESYDAAMFAVGAMCDGIDFIMKKEESRAFCVVRPPGHHATAEQGMGFCVFNNVAVAARYAQKKHDIKRVLIADWDVHHGNGTQDIFYSDPDVFFFSTHQWPCYPGTGRQSETGAGKGKGTTMNFPFPPGSGAKEIVGAFEDKLTTTMKEFKPELVLISAGFDSRKGDTIGNFELSDDDFSRLTQIVCEIADKHASGRVLSTLEGGYELGGLGSAAAAHFAALKA